MVHIEHTMLASENKFWCVPLFLSTFIIYCRSKDSYNCCQDILPQNYERHRFPKLNGLLNNIFVAFQVLDIGEIDEENMDYLFHLFVNMAWKDTRLKLNVSNKTNFPMFLHDCCFQNIWRPDLFFETVKHIENFHSHTNVILEVLPDGTLYSSTKYLVKSGCRMDFTYYPFDEQHCIFVLGLMRPDTETILKWINDESSPYKDTIDVIQMVRNPEPLQFYFQGLSLHSITEVFGDRSYTSLLTNITLKRRLAASVINTYGPSTMIVVMSWVTFWVETSAVAARVALSVTSLLTLCTQVDQYKSQLPPVSYMKAMDIWLFVCIVMVFSTLLEFAIAYNLSTKQCKYCSNKNQVTSNNSPSIATKLRRRNLSSHSWTWGMSKRFKRTCHFPENIQHHRSVSQNSFFKKRPTHQYIPTHCLTFKQYSKFVDNISKKLFPSLFIIFCVIYWTYFLTI